MILRELGVDITPALTGAGIVGLAVGFGAQTIVRDVISGFFLILEDQVPRRRRRGRQRPGRARRGGEPADDRAARRGRHGPRLPERRGEDAREQVEGLLLLRDHVRRRLRRRSRAGHGGDARRRRRRCEAIREFKPHILAPLEVYGMDAFEDTQLVVKGASRRCR